MSCQNNKELIIISTDDVLSQAKIAFEKENLMDKILEISVSDAAIDRLNSVFSSFQNYNVIQATIKTETEIKIAPEYIEKLRNVTLRGLYKTVSVIFTIKTFGFCSVEPAELFKAFAKASSFSITSKKPNNNDYEISFTFDDCLLVKMK